MERVLQNFVSLGLKVFFHAVDLMLEKNGESSQNFNSENGDEKRLFDYNLNCQGVNSDHRWENGPQFYRFAQHRSVKFFEWTASRSVFLV
jgi:hypothetical protein